LFETVFPAFKLNSTPVVMSAWKVKPLSAVFKLISAPVVRSVWNVTSSVLLCNVPSYSACEIFLACM
jgi:hypothetical protein